MHKYAPDKDNGEKHSAHIDTNNSSANNINHPLETEYSNQSNVITINTTPHINRQRQKIAYFLTNALKMICVTRKFYLVLLPEAAPRSVLRKRCSENMQQTYTHAEV